MTLVRPVVFLTGVPLAAIIMAQWTQVRRVRFRNAAVISSILWAVSGCAEAPSSSSAADHRDLVRQHHAESVLQVKETKAYQRVVDLLNKGTVADGDGQLIRACGIDGRHLQVKEDADVYNTLSHQLQVTVNTTMLNEWSLIFNKYHHTKKSLVSFSIFDLNGELLYHDETLNSNG